MIPQVCIQSNDSQMGVGETLGRQPGDGARWVCDLKARIFTLVHRRALAAAPIATSTASFQREEELSEAYRSSVFSGNQLCFFKAQDYTHTLRLWCRSELAPFWFISTPSLDTRQHPAGF